MEHAAGAIRQAEQHLQTFCTRCEAGVWEALLEHFAQDTDLEYLIINSTIIRAYSYAAGTQKRVDQTEQALGRSRGGFCATILLRRPRSLWASASVIHARTRNVVEGARGEESSEQARR